jgi:hypothetical protein
MSFKNELRDHNMILRPHCFTNRFQKVEKKPKSCMKTPNAVKCATRHRQCKDCPFQKFFKSGKDRPYKQ